MKKKNIFFIIIPIILLLIIVILLLANKRHNNWIDNILKEDYEIYTIDCDGTTNILDSSVLKQIKNNWTNLSNNGPFLGDLNICYKKIIIDHNNDIVNIEIIDNSSVIIKESKTSDYYIYYTNADKLITYLNNYFN